MSAEFTLSTFQFAGYLTAAFILGMVALAAFLDWLDGDDDGK